MSENNAVADAAALRTWLLSDGNAGNVRQITALADALAMPGHRVDLHPGWAPRWFAPRRVPGLQAPFGAQFHALCANPPALAIGCGRQAAMATRLLRARGSQTVQILDPRIDPAHWDLVIAPQHDGVRGSNVIAVLGGLHPVDDAWLAQAQAHFARFAALPRPRTAVLLGGSTRHARFDDVAFEAMAAHLDAALQRSGGSLLVTASRRTEAELRGRVRYRYGDTPGVIWLGADDGENPYAGLLAWADRIVCSPDSVNMISEACATHAPVYVFDPGRVRGRPRLFLDALLARGRIRAMDGALADYPVEPLRETARVAAQVRERLHL